MTEKMTSNPLSLATAPILGQAPSLQDPLEHSQNFISARFTVSFKSWSLLFSVVSVSKDDEDDRYSSGSFSVFWNTE